MATFSVPAVSMDIAGAVVGAGAGAAVGAGAAGTAVGAGAAVGSGVLGTGVEKLTCPGTRSSVAQAARARAAASAMTVNTVTSVRRPDKIMRFIAIPPSKEKA
ncbi:MAG: hypothetical protein F4X94_06545 [Dehalococcoidia bacterium]|nr:hypothetical protein [Dehalococcoidia bacterium]